MIFYIWLRLWRAADTQPHGYESILLVKRAAIDIDLKRKQK